MTVADNSKPTHLSTFTAAMQDALIALGTEYLEMRAENQDEYADAAFTEIATLIKGYFLAANIVVEESLTDIRDEVIDHCRKLAEARA